MKWFVLYTKSKFEKKVASHLSKLGYEVYCPMKERDSKYYGKSKLIEEPLFKSYVFVKHAKGPKTDVLVTPGVVKYLYWLGKPAIVREEEINAIENWLSKGNVDECLITSISSGDRIKIKKGVFKGKDGVVKEIGKGSVKIILQELGCSVILKTTCIV
ncbi:transcription termination/antitermination protein NusG [Zunongwangia sp.]|uniref:transcription termination/antitermination protein NusG n=1 Tax=Zunongwangia sp. TaxID=1965325 RepID=UPI003AA7F1CE